MYSCSEGLLNDVCKYDAKNSVPAVLCTSKCSMSQPFSYSRSEVLDFLGVGSSSQASPPCQVVMMRVRRVLAPGPQHCPSQGLPSGALCPQPSPPCPDTLRGQGEQGSGLGNRNVLSVREAEGVLGEAGLGLHAC